MARRHQTAIRFEQSGSLCAKTEPLSFPVSVAQLRCGVAFGSIPAAHILTFYEAETPFQEGCGTRKVYSKDPNRSWLGERCAGARRGLLHQFVGVTDGNGQVGAAEIIQDSEIYANHFAVAIEERSPRAPRGGRRIVNNFVL